MKSLMSGSKAVFAAILCVTFVVLLGIFPASGLESDGSRVSKADSNLKFSIDSLSPYAISNNPINLTISTKATNSNIHIDVLRATNTRSELFDFVNDLGNRPARDSMDIALSSFSTTSTQGQYSIQLPLNTGDPAGLSITQTGIYPIAISQTDREDDSDAFTQYSFITYVPSVSENGSAYAHKLNVVPLMKFSPIVDLTKVLDSNRQLTKYGMSARSKMISAQTSATSVIDIPHSIVLSPEAIAAWNYIQTAGNAGTAKSLFDPAVSTSERIADTYSPINIAELEKYGLNSVYADILAAGRTVVTDEGFTSASRTLVTAAMTPNSIEPIAQTGIDNVIVDDITFPSGNRPSSRPAKLVKNNSTLRVATADTSIEENLTKKLSPSAQANYILAATSIVMLEAPSVERSFIVPLNLEKLSPLTIRQIYFASENNPLIDFSSVQTFFSQSEDTAMSKKLAKLNYPKVITPAYEKSDLNNVEKYARATQSMFSKTSDQEIQANWMHMAAYSRADRQPEKLITASKAKSLMQSVNQYVALPEKRTLTITSRENNIPVTIRNLSGKRIDVVVSLSADKLAFPKGDKFKVSLIQENTTVHIPVKTRTSGSFPIEIQILTPRESIVVAEQGATVRSTAVSGIGIAIAFASLLFLAFWWMSHIRKTRKQPIAEVIELSHENAG